MPRNGRQGEIFEHLVLLRDCYPLRSGYDRDPVMSIRSAITYAELLLAHSQEADSPHFGWFRRAA